MNKQHIPASKPLQFSAKPPVTLTATPSDALRGATSAFLPKLPVAPSNISTTTAGARLAASTAGTTAQQRTTQTLVERNNEQKEQSPPRGRHLQTNASITRSAAQSALSPSRPQHSPRPQLASRSSSSTLAARHASTHSRSPHRSTSRNPYSKGPSSILTGSEDHLATSPDALNGAIASMASISEHDLISNDSSQSVRSRIMNFENIPSLVPARAPRIVHSPPEEDVVFFQNDGGHSMASSPASRSPRTLSDTEIHSTYVKQGRSHSPGSLRQSSAMVTTTKSSVHGIKASQSEGASKLSVHPATTALKIPSSSLAKSPPHVVSLHREDSRATMTVNALADAMVASSIASSRAGSPSKKPPPPAPRRRSRSVTALQELTKLHDGHRRTPSKRQNRPMKQTLRKHTSSDDESAELMKRGRRHLMRKHPNKHAEGDRKRWRDKVTDAERKRYEGVFAANRGLLIGPGYFEPSADALSDNTSAGNNVVNVVVRDIWERSRLPREVLQEIYDLVSPEEAAVLNREQFVVGMWLVDQRLKGRKLPVKVGTSVWGSVRHSQGIKIRNNQH